MRTLLALIAVPLTAVTMLVASQAAALAESDDWDFRFTPYLWVPSLDTTASVLNSPEADSSRSILEILEFAALTSFEAHHDDFFILGEANYLDLGSNATGQSGLFDADIDIEGFMVALNVGTELYRDEALTLEAFGGARIWSLETSVDFENLPRAAVTKTWVDPMFGGRITYDLTDKISFQALTDIGGFGVGSEFQWEMLGRVGYAFNDRITLAAGYRHLDVRFDRNDLDLDLALTGPFISVDINF